MDQTNKIPIALRQRYLKIIYDDLKSICKTTQIACEKAAEQEKSIYDRAKTKNTYVNLAAHLTKNIRSSQNQPKSNLDTGKLLQMKNKLSYSHEAILSGPKCNKINYSINRTKPLTLNELSRKALAFFVSSIKNKIIRTYLLFTSDQSLQLFQIPYTHPYTTRRKWLSM